MKEKLKKKFQFFFLLASYFKFISIHHVVLNDLPATRKQLFMQGRAIQEFKEFIEECGWGGKVGGAVMRQFGCSDAGYNYIGSAQSCKFKKSKN